MKSTGVIRRIDELGRMVVPKEIRNKLSIATGDPIEIYVEGEQIILKKCEDVCTFCSSAAALTEFFGRKICKSCLEELKNL